MEEIQCSSFMKRTLIIAGVLAVLSAVCLWGFNHKYRIGYQQFLYVEDAGGREEAVLPLGTGRFTLKYTHSVHQTPVCEEYRTAEDNQMVLTETSFFSYGVGIPFTAEEGVFVYKEGKFFITGLHRGFRCIPMRVSAIPDHMIIIDGRSYPLLSFCEPGGLIKITTGKKRVLQRR